MDTHTHTHKMGKSSSCLLSLLRGPPDSSPCCVQSRQWAVVTTVVHGFQEAKLRNQLLALLGKRVNQDRGCGRWKGFTDWMSGQQDHYPSSTKDLRLICSNFTLTPHSIDSCSFYIMKYMECVDQHMVLRDGHLLAA